MKHEAEFPLKPIPAAGEDVRHLAAAYSRTFGSDDGRRVLADLLTKFSPDRPRFFGHSDAIRAAHIDGQCDVMREIQKAIAAGSTMTGIPTQP